MIKWYHTLYTEEKLQKRIHKIIDRIENERLTVRVFCIALAANPDNMLDIIDANELLFQHYKQNEIYILGVAQTKAGAISMTVKIIQEIYEKTNDVKVRDYFPLEGFDADSKFIQYRL